MERKDAMNGPNRYLLDITDIAFHYNDDLFSAIYIVGCVIHLDYNVQDYVQRPSTMYLLHISP